MNISSVITVGLGQRLRSGYEALNARLAFIYRLCSRVPYAPVMEEKWSHSVRRGEVIRLSGNVRHLEIREGTIWLTATPAQGDVLLQTGDSLELTGRSDYVVESLEDAEISVESGLKL